MCDPSATTDQPAYAGRSSPWLNCSHLTQFQTRCDTMRTGNSEIRIPRSEIPPRAPPPHPADPTADSPAGDGAGRGKRAARGGVSQAPGAPAGIGTALRDRDSSRAAGEHGVRPRARRRDTGRRSVDGRLDVLPVERRAVAGDL